MWFKNLYVFNFVKPIPFQPHDLIERLPSKKFTPRAPTQRSSCGWAAPLGDDTITLAHTVGTCTLISLETEEAILPAQVIANQLKARVKRIQNAEQRVVANQEKKQLREEIEAELLPKAFSKRSRTDAWVDHARNRLVIDTSSANTAEQFAKVLRSTFDTLPVEPMGMKDGSLQPMLSQWLITGLPSVDPDFEWGSSVTLESSEDDGGKVVYTNQDVMAPEIDCNLEAGKQVVEIAMVYKDRLQFTLGANSQIKKLKFLDIIHEKLEDEDPQTHAEDLDIRFAIMTAEVGNMIADLLNLISTR